MMSLRWGVTGSASQLGPAGGGRDTGGGALSWSAVAANQLIFARWRAAGDSSGRVSIGFSS